MMLARGTLMTVDNTIDNTTGTVKLRAQFANQNAALFPNQFVNVRMRVDTLHDVVIVPGAGIQRGTQGTFVYVVGDDSKVTLRVVKLGVTEGERTQVASGLNPGERVVIDGADKLRDGASVEVIQPGASPASAPAAVLRAVSPTAPRVARESSSWATRCSQAGSRSCRRAHPAQPVGRERSARNGWPRSPARSLPHREGPRRRGRCRPKRRRRRWPGVGS